jgi:transcriptional regulator with XRE-family HTH domain
MSKDTSDSRKAKVFPKDLALLKVMGEQIKLAIKRRSFSQSLISERTGLSRLTIRRITEGSPRVSMGHYVMVLSVLNLSNDLLLVAKDDVLGRKLQDIKLLNKTNKEN